MFDSLYFTAPFFNFPYWQTDTEQAEAAPVFFLNILSNVLSDVMGDV